MTTNFKRQRNYLEAERKRLLEDLKQLESTVSNTEVRREGSPFGKREEEATESFELEKRLVLEKQVKEQLAEIEHALQKFKEGTYGLCDICGRAIDPARLEALPKATLCVDCKEKSAKGKVPQT